MKLNIKQRFAVAGIYICLIIGIGYYFSEDWKFLIDTNNKLNLVLVTTGLALILSSYISEPYFSKPVDVITRWTAIFLFIIGLNSNNYISLYKYWIIASGIFITISLTLILLHSWRRFEKQQRIAVDFICKVSRPQIVFTILYFDIVISLFNNKSAEYPVLIGFGFLLVINKPVIWIVEFTTSFFTKISSVTDNSKFLGQIIGHESADLYKIEITAENPFKQKELKGKLVFLENITNGIIGIILNERILLGKKWLDIITLRDTQNNTISFNLKSSLPLIGEKSIFSKSNAVYLLDIESIQEGLQEILNKNPIVANFDKLIGIVWEGSTINKIRFNKLFSDQLQIERSIGEGSIVQTKIAGKDVLYQIIDARTNEESLEYKDSHGFIIGTAQKLGKYINKTNELNTVKWLPEIYTPIFLLNPLETDYQVHNFIGKLPNTNYGIPIKRYDELVTHNTAILGILGIGKSCLTFELLQKLINNTDVKIFCIDLTNQYSRELSLYLNKDLIQDDFSPAIRSEIKDAIKTGNNDNSKSWGNVPEYRKILSNELDIFIESQKRILVTNPDWHNVEKANSEYRITHNTALSASEKTRIISEELFVKAKKQGESQDARYLIVFEEAHSLVPEWNSVSNDGDKNATNGTAKVILQGRKYGLGSMVVTQRTANISKSILNQCNTIFALRVFDDTGKQFLENYIGSEYSNLLPTLEERHCIAIGKALKLKQPVIIELNDMKHIIIEN